MSRLQVFAVAVVALAFLSGCGPGDGPAIPTLTPTETPTATPTPTPTPTPELPAISSLTLSPDGLGALFVGQAPPVGDPRSDIIVLSPTACQWAVDEGYLDDPAKWVANYAPALSGHDPSPFGVFVEGGVLQAIAIYDDSIETAAGIHLGSDATEVAAAYPDVELLAEDGYSDTHVYRLAGSASDLYIDVLKAESVEYYPEIGAEVVVRLNVLAHGQHFAGFNSDWGLGVCVGA